MDGISTDELPTEVVPSISLSQKKQICQNPWCLLQAVPYLGPVTLRQLLEHWPNPQDILQLNPLELKAHLHPKSFAALVDFHRLGDSSEICRQIQHQQNALQRCQGWCLTPEDNLYPRLLKTIDDPPMVLFGRGNPKALNLPQLAVIGSRNSSRQGQQIAHSFSAALARSGFAITSGLAQGIDGASHRGCLSTSGSTIAVLGSGVDVLYPANHRALAEDIINQGGAVISEYPPGTAPRAGHFPRRNRIISGLSLGVLVVEAAVKSGSLITARVAAEQNREVFAIPGSINNPLSKGCHQLLKDGAALVETAQDIVDELGGMLAFKREDSAAELVDEGIEEDPNGLLSNLGYDPSSIDELVAVTGINAADIASQLLELELEGLVEQVPGGYQRLA